MSEERLTPEERAVIKAARAWNRGDDGHALVRAVDAYEASQRPQPVECLMTRPCTNEDDPDGWGCAWPLTHVNHCDFDVEVWRVTITPIERVR